MINSFINDKCLPSGAKFYYPINLYINKEILSQV